MGMGDWEETNMLTEADETTHPEALQLRYYVQERNLVSFKLILAP